MSYDFSGYATRNDIQCADGRVIKRDAFKDCDHTTVPLVWQHDHMSTDNVLGHALLENRNDGVYAYGTFNDTQSGRNAKELVKNGDVRALSIYANQLKQQGRDVVHGAIREVSLVLAGANPGAYIDTVLVHSDADEEEAVICFDSTLELYHADEPEEDISETEDVKNDEGDDMADTNEKTVGDVINSMTEEQKNVLYALVGLAAEGKLNADNTKSGSNNEEAEMKHNVFDSSSGYLAHSKDYAAVLRDGKRYGSLKESAIQHGCEDMTLGDVLQHDDYGMENIDYLFPDYRNVTETPGFVSRDMEWVDKVMNSVSHTPFSRIRSVFADITADEARAKGYLKGNQKTNEVFTLLRRTTDPQTVYKKQKLDRDDVVDITDFDVVAWLKGEMRTMLNEELGRAFLIGDGRDTSSEDKIYEDHIRPIWTDDDFYTIKAQVSGSSDDDDDAKYKSMIRAAISARKDYKGSGDPTFYTTEEVLTGMLLLTDDIGRDLYDSPEQLAKKMLVKEIVTVPVMEDQTREDDDGNECELVGIIVNLKDYNVGADQGGAVNLFDDFDIDYNAMKYLIETRCSGALIKPYSAIALEYIPASSSSDEE